MPPDPYPNGVRRQMDFPKKKGKSYDESKGGQNEENADKPIESYGKHHFGEERDDYQANEKGSDGAHGNRNAGDMPPAFEHVEFAVESVCIIGSHYIGLFGKRPAAIDDAGQTAGHDIEHAGNTSQEEDGAQCELDGGGDVSDGLEGWRHEVMWLVSYEDRKSMHVRAAIRFAYIILNIGLH